MTTFVFCTQNQHKINEVSQIMGSKFAFLKPSDVGFYDEIPEPFPTLEENAAVKSMTVFRHCGKPCFAEDTGLFIEALGGEPGVYSARYAGEPSNPKKNIEKVLSSMHGITDRRAFFKTVISVVYGHVEQTFEGICTGKIAQAESGFDGFGYDPIFIPDPYDMTFAEMSAEEKNNVSHRKRAFARFAAFLHEQFQMPDQ